MRDNSVYRNAECYDLDYSYHVEDIPFYLEFAEMVCAANPAKSRALEIACGTGRITIPLALNGINVTGLDLSPTMLEKAKKKATQSRVNINWVEADCRDFSLNQKFDLIYIPFNSMQHLLTIDSVESFLNCVKAHMNPNAYFIAEVNNPNLKVLMRDPSQRYYVSNILDPNTGVDILIEEVVRYDEATQVSYGIWYYSVGGKRDHRIETLTMRNFFPQEFDAIFHYNGFKTRSKFGSHTKKPFEKDDPTQIVVCQL